MGYIQIFCIFSYFMAVISEPQCSPFHYQEQLLKKMIEVKYKLEKWETAMSEKMAKIDESLKKQELVETRNSDWMSQQQNLIDKSLQEFGDTVHEKMGKIGEIEQNQLQLENSIADQLTRHPVYFKARSVKNLSPAVDETLVFQTIVQNEGQGYNPDTGVYIVPQSGTYIFSVQLCLDSNKYIGFNIVANQYVITAATFGDADYSYMCTLTDGIATLSEGDEVKVVVTQRSSTSIIYGDSEKRYWSYFSGVLLHK